MKIKLIQVPPKEEIADGLITDIGNKLAYSLHQLDGYGSKKDVHFLVDLESMKAMWVSGLLDIFEFIENNRRVGFAFASKNKPLFQAKSVATIHSIYVEEFFRGNNVLKQFIDYAKTIYQAQSIDYLHFTIPNGFEKLAEPFKDKLFTYETIVGMEIK